MPEAPWGISNRWLSHIQIDSAVAGTTREAVLNVLAAENIEARPLWKPLHMQPVFAGCRAYVNGTAERLFSRGLSLPSGSALTQAELERVAALVRKAIPAAPR